jgi:hypothetical protein
MTVREDEDLVAYKRALGVDLATNIGGVVHVYFTERKSDRRIEIVRITPVFAWKVGKRKGRSVLLYASTFTSHRKWAFWQNRAKEREATHFDLFHFAQSLIDVITPALDIGLPIGIDWSDRSVFWGRRLQAVHLAVIFGYLCRGLFEHGCFPLAIAADQIRASLSLTQKVEKEELHSIVRDRWTWYTQARLQWDNLTLDEKDAVVLAVIAGKAAKRGQEGLWKAQTTPTQPSPA